jgi:hypothetical protein
MFANLAENEHNYSKIISLDIISVLVNSPWIIESTNVKIQMEMCRLLGNLSIYSDTAIAMATDRSVTTLLLLAESQNNLIKKFALYAIGSKFLLSIEIKFA